MVYLTSWEEFSRAVENLYSADPMKVSYLIKLLNQISEISI
jgi:hypothetical protein